MVNRTVDEQNEIEKAAAIARKRDKARAFREVFTSPRGMLVLQALKEKFGDGLPPNILGDDSHTDPYQTWRRLGHFDVIESIKQLMEWKEDSNEHTSRTGT